MELPATRQPVAACAVIQPEDKVLFNNCLAILEVLQDLCKRNSTCPRDNSSPLSFSLAPAFLQSSAHEHCTGGKSLCLPTQCALLSVILHLRKSSLQGDAAGDWSLCKLCLQDRCCKLPHVTNSSRTQCLHILAVAIHARGWILLFLLGPKPSGFLRAPGAVWGEQRWQRPDLQELGCSVQSNLRHCRLSQLDVDTVLNMEMKENLL